MNLAITRLTRTIAANQTINVDAAGTYVLFYANTGTFNFSIDGGPLQAGFSALGIRVPAENGQTPRPFRQLVLQDTSGAANTINFIVANGAIDYTPTAPTAITKNSPTYSKATGILALADAARATFTGVDGGNTRKQIAVSNHNASGGTTIYLGDTSGNIGAIIPPQQSVTIEVSGQVTVVNTTGSGASNYSVIETFYN